MEPLEDRTTPALLLPATLRGAVFCDDNNNGQRDPGEAGIAGVTVTLRRGSRVVARRTTDAGGAYQFNNLIPGTYTIVEGAIPAGTDVTGDGRDSLGRIPGIRRGNWGRADQNDRFRQIRLGRGNNGVDYNFGERCQQPDPGRPGIDLIKFVNGQDANTPPGPFINVFEGTVTFTYEVRNTGTVPLGHVVLIDDNGTADPSDDFMPMFTGGDTNGNGLLDLNEIWTYASSPLPPLLNLHTNIATVTARDALNRGVTDSDPANYTGVTDGGIDE